MRTQELGDYFNFVSRPTEDFADVYKLTFLAIWSQLKVHALRCSVAKIDVESSEIASVNYLGVHFP